MRCMIYVKEIGCKRYYPVSPDGYIVNRLLYAAIYTIHNNEQWRGFLNFVDSAAPGAVAQVRDMDGKTIYKMGDKHRDIFPASADAA